MTTESKGDDALIDWTLTTWEGSRREQLRRWAALPLEQVVLALEQMEQLAEQLSRPRPAQQLADRDQE